MNWIDMSSNTVPVRHHYWTRVLESSITFCLVTPDTSAFVSNAKLHLGPRSPPIPSPLRVFLIFFRKWCRKEAWQDGGVRHWWLLLLRNTWIPTSGSFQKSRDIFNSKILTVLNTTAGDFFSFFSLSSSVTITKWMLFSSECGCVTFSELRNLLQL